MYVIMKKHIVVAAMAALTLALIIVGCEKITGDSKDGFQERKLLISSEDFVVVGSYSSGSPEITIPNDALDSIYRYYYSNVIGEEAEFTEAEIIDDPDIDSAYVYIFLYGNVVWNEASASLGIPVVRTEDEEYVVSAVCNTSAWSCTGDDCSSCSPNRNWFLGKVTGCSCNDEEGHCNHTVSGKSFMEWVVKVIPLFS